MKKYSFSTIKDRLFIGGASAFGIGALLAGAAFVFGPVGVAAAAAYGLGRTLFAYYKDVYLRKNALADFEDQAVPAEAEISQHAADISRRFGMKKAPKVYLTAPEGEDDDKKFSSLPFHGAIVVTEKSLRRHLPKGGLRFIVAHEMSHIHVDSGFFSFFPKELMRHVRDIFGVATAGVCLAAIGDFSLPFGIISTSAAAWQSFEVFMAADLGKVLGDNFASRTKERRADRNAIYVTRDLGAAEAVMRKTIYKEDEKTNKFLLLLKEPLRSHPSRERRISSLKKAFNKVSKYPALPEVKPSSGASPKGRGAVPS